ncbi:hypothetical protein I545_0966 [Mycobacterium kansasii 662]|uniref:Uncharacterized protein n=2 Tax=Mycobacterium kansasii TaxID=1768 RepID=A0A1V3XVI3_MYCKA|nr:hypothetical protein I547_0303 [Mycobacterium kansasii 824]EUA21281.1 hypothetical protein I545_0966 [Mycobacterium kansasii 662]KEP42942.1 hypothetical protein MKSMC1_18890 [Mycobacterium kansasii]OOK83098.1 hypothetical protein BZL29_1163 [Mycobacterium kansasii]
MQNLAGPHGVTRVSASPGCTCVIGAVPLNLRLCTCGPLGHTLRMPSHSRHDGWTVT